MRSMWRGLVFAVTALSAVSASAQTYYIDQYDAKIDGTTVFSDTFSDGVAPPSGPTGPADYFFTIGSFPSGSESGGKLALDPTTNGELRSIQGNQFKLVEAVNSTFFSASSSFSITGLFDLVATPQADLNAYGTFFSDAGFDGSGNFFAYDVVLTVDALAGGNQQVTFHAFDEISGTEEILLRQDISTNHDSIALTFDHETGTSFITASYQYFDGGVANGGPISFGSSYSFKSGFGVGGFLAIAPETPTVTAPVPEPETYALMMSGLGILGAVVRRRKKAAKQ